MTPRDGYTCEWVECLHADGLADARASLCFQVQTHPALISDLTHAYKRHRRGKALDSRNFPRRGLAQNSSGRTAIHARTSASLIAARRRWCSPAVPVELQRRCVRKSSGHGDMLSTWPRGSHGLGVCVVPGFQ